MSTQQDIYEAGFKNRPPMLNKENYVSWSSRLLRYAKSRPNGKLIYNSIINGPYVRQMISQPGDPNHKVLVNKTFHVQTDDELIEKELKQIEADDQAIQTILLGLPEDIYAAVDSCETAQEIWLRVQQMMKGSDNGIQEKKAKLFNECEINPFQKRLPEVDDLKAERLARTQDPLALMATSNNPYTFPGLRQYQPSFNQNYMQQPIPNPEDITDPTIAMNMALALMAKAFKLNYSTPTNNNQRISSNPRNRQFAQSGNLNGYNDIQNVRNQVIQNADQNPRIQNVGNQNGLIVVPGKANLNGNGNLVTARTEGNATGHNGNQIRCYNCKRLGHFARNCTVRPKRRDAAYLQTQLLIAQKKEAGIQLQAEEFDLMAAAADLDEIEEVNANGILMANLQQASTLGTQTDKASVYDSDGSAQNDNNVISEVSSVEQSGGTVEQHPANVKETGQSIHMLSPKPDSFYHTKQKMTLGYQNPFYLKQAQQKQQSLYDGKVLFEKHDPLVVHDSEKTLQLAQEKFLDDTTPSVARKFLNEVKSTIVILQRVVKQRMTLDTHNWSSSAHQELHKIVKYEIFPIVNQVDARVQNFKIQFLKEAAKFVGDFKSLAKEADESLAKHKELELEIEHLLSTVISQDIISVVQNNSVGETSNLKTKLEHNTKIKRPQPRSNTKNDRVLSASKSSRSKNKEVKVEAHHRKLMLSRNKKHMSSECNNVKLATQNVKSKVVCAMCKQCLISVNHDVCLLNYVNGMTSRGKKQKANVSINEKQKKHNQRLRRPRKSGPLKDLLHLSLVNLDLSLGGHQLEECLT
nr:hypothetical protein [Tanacetum cinerariifolium]